MGQTNSGLNICTELYSFYHRLSELSFISDSIAYHCDLGWASLECYKDEDDKALWNAMVENEENPYMRDLNKVSCITLLLYKYRAVDTVSYKNRVYKFYTNKYRKGNVEFVEHLDITMILIRHKQMQQTMSKEGMDVMYHLDVCIAILQPYFTEEDMFTLEKIAIQDPYNAMIQKEMLTSVVMDRADMLFGRGMVDRKGGAKWGLKQSQTKKKS